MLNPWYNILPFFQKTSYKGSFLSKAEFLLQNNASLSRSTSIKFSLKFQERSWDPKNWDSIKIEKLYSEWKIYHSFHIKKTEKKCSNGHKCTSSTLPDIVQWAKDEPKEAWNTFINPVSYWSGECNNSKGISAKVEQKMKLSQIEYLIATLVFLSTSYKDRITSRWDCKSYWYGRLVMSLNISL